MKQISFLGIFVFFGINCMFQPISEKEAIKKFHLFFIYFKKENSNLKKISYIETGNFQSKKLLFFIHGSPGSWDAYIEYLKDKELQNFHLISINRLGYADSEMNQVEKSLETQAKVFLPILERYKQKEIFLIGHSFGGPVALELNFHFQNIKGILLLAPSIDPEKEEILWYQKLALNPFISFFIPGPLDVCNKEIFTLKEELIHQKRIYPNLKTKIIYIHGKKDNLVPYQNFYYLQKNISDPKNLKSILLENANHFIVWNQFELVKKEIFSLVD